MHLVANAGVLVACGGQKLLIDALFDPARVTGTEAGAFSGPTTQALEAMLAGRPPYDGITHLLFTHDHPDHFDAARTEAFLARNPVAGLVLPSGMAGAYPALGGHVRAGGGRVYELDLPLGAWRGIHLGDTLALTVFRTPHAGGKNFADVEQYCFLLGESGGESLLIAADSDYLPDYFAQMLAGRRLDAALVNPLFLNRSDGRRTVTAGMRPARLLVYHLPFGGADPLGLRPTAAYDARKYAEELPPVVLLVEEGQSVPL